MEMFQFIGIVVAAAIIYAVITLVIGSVIVYPDIDLDIICSCGWIIGMILFCIVAYCWITGVPSPF